MKMRSSAMFSLKKCSFCKKQCLFTSLFITLVSATCCQLRLNIKCVSAQIECTRNLSSVFTVLLFILHFTVAQLRVLSTPSNGQRSGFFRDSFELFLNQCLSPTEKIVMCRSYSQPWKYSRNSTLSWNAMVFRLDTLQWQLSSSKY